MHLPTKRGSQATAIHKKQAKDCEDHALCHDAMTTIERDELNTIRSNTTNDGGGGSVDNNNLEHDAWEMDVNSIPAGEDTMAISHAGGEFASVVEIADDLLGTANQ